MAIKTGCEWWGIDHRYSPHATQKTTLYNYWYTKKSIYLVPCTVREINSWIKSANNYRVSVLDNTLLYMCSYLISFCFLDTCNCRNWWQLHVLDFALHEMLIFVLIIVLYFAKYGILIFIFKLSIVIGYVKNLLMNYIHGTAKENWLFTFLHIWSWKAAYKLPLWFWPFLAESF